MNHRCTKEELLDRYEQAANLLAEGWPGHAVVAQLSKRFDVTPQQARTYVREGRKLLIESVGVENRASMFAQVFTGLQMDRMEARQNGNSSAAVGASKAMVQLLKQLSEIDPMRDFENAFMVAVAPHLNNGKGSIPREKIDIHQPPNDPDGDDLQPGSDWLSQEDPKSTAGELF
jgi:hypothetical protein